MGNWNDVLEEVNKEAQKLQAELARVMDTVRRRNLKKYADYTNRNVIAYYSGFMVRPKVEGIEIIDDDKNAFMSCVYRLDKNKGLDLILYTPDGNVAVSEYLVHYLREIFGTDVRAVVPEMAMSVGTMIACSCSEILMGKESNLGPIDPHLNGILADLVLAEFRRAYEEIQSDPRRAALWAPILGRYTPTFLTQCEHAVEWTKKFVGDCLSFKILPRFGGVSFGLRASRRAPESQTCRINERREAAA